MRIVSLIPSGTEIVCALGYHEYLVGISHECDFPLEIRHLPVCTKPRLNADTSSLEIDKSVKSLLLNSLSIYAINENVLKELKPDVIITQSQCDVCAVSLADVELVLQKKIGLDPKIISLQPQKLSDIWEDINLIAKSLGVAKKGLSLTNQIKNNIENLKSSQNSKIEPTVACVEWITPLMFAGNWVPEMVEIAGGKDLFGRTGMHSDWSTYDMLFKYDPEKIIFMPCGFNINKTLEEMKIITDMPNWKNLKAVKTENVFITDGNQYFNRPGPRILDSIKILIEIVSNQKIDFGYKDKGWEKFSN
ncbi:MAG: cobalamin-binding protein [bacterium TMED264]|nr:MAG: cobalamin-binding protein [bacterium TMED264]